MSAQVGVGLVGCGRIARMFHLPVLAGLDSARVVAVADTDQHSRAAASVLAPGSTPVPDLQTMLGMPDIDAVFVCLPTHLHAEAAIAAFEAARAVYVEKPLATTVAEAELTHQAWLAGGRTGTVGFNFRFHPLYRHARQRVAAGELGELVAVRGMFASAPRELPAWKRERATGGGALLDLAAHHVDLVRHLLDTEVSAVSAELRSVQGEQDTAALTLGLADGGVAQLLATVTAAAADRMELIGTRATIEVDRMAARRTTTTPAVAGAGGVTAARAAVAHGALRTYDRLRPPPEPSFAAALSAFVDEVAGRGTGNGPTVDDGLRCMQVLDAAERSAASGRRVEVTG